MSEIFFGKKDRQKDRHLAVEFRDSLSDPLAESDLPVDTGTGTGTMAAPPNLPLLPFFASSTARVPVLKLKLPHRGQFLHFFRSYYFDTDFPFLL
jgi:hypothetical protein